jgi:WD40 repeat protein
MDSLVHVWDAQTLERKYTLRGHSNHFFSAVFTPDGVTLITGSGNRRDSRLPSEVKLWDLATGQCRATFGGQTGPVALSAEARMLVTVDNSTSARLWRADSAAGIPPPAHAP